MFSGFCISFDDHAAAFLMLAGRFAAIELQVGGMEGHAEPWPASMLGRST